MNTFDMSHGLRMANTNKAKPCNSQTDWLLNSHTSLRELVIADMFPHPFFFNAAVKEE
ncbi:hypothetical protein AB8880_12155 [Alphaproteobacteria bacterium LSUCC0684]